MKYLFSIFIFLTICYSSNAQVSYFQNDIQTKAYRLSRYHFNSILLSHPDNKRSLVLNKKRKNAFPNFFVGGTFMTINAGRLAGMFSYSFEGVYIHDRFSAHFRSVFSYGVSPEPDSGIYDNYPNAFRNFNITEVYGTYFFYTYESKKEYRAFTGKVRDFGQYLVLYYKKGTTRKTNKFGARLGFVHDQENAIYMNNAIEKNGYVLRSYSANSIMIGISKMTSGQQKYGNYFYLLNKNFYFDLMINVYGTETYSEYIGDGKYDLHEGLDLYNYRLGWRIGYVSRSQNGKKRFFGLMKGLELGQMPVPKYSSGLYILMKLGFVFYGTAGK